MWRRCDCAGAVRGCGADDGKIFIVLRWDYAAFLGDDTMAVHPGEIFLSLWAEQFGAIFGRERVGLGYESGLGGLVGLGGW